MTQAVTPQHGRSSSAGRPAWLVPVAAIVAVLVVAGGIIAVVVSSRDTPAVPTPEASTVQLLSPVPTIAPVPRATATIFTALLPTSLLQYALAASVVDEEWIAANALEAWSETYTDGASAALTVRAGQWETPAEATAFAATLVAAVPTAAPAPGATSTSTAAAPAPQLPRTGDVTAAGAVVGTFTIVDAGDGTGVAVWTNGTSVFRLVAPVADVLDAYAAYPL